MRSYLFQFATLLLLAAPAAVLAQSLKLRPEHPHHLVIAAGCPVKATARCLAEPGTAHAVYIKGDTRATLTLELPKAITPRSELIPAPARRRGRRRAGH